MNQPVRTRVRTPEQTSLPGETSKQEPERGGGVGATRVKYKLLEGRCGRLVVTAGNQRFSPIQFQSFEIAPLELSIDLEKGDDVEAIAAEALALLRAIQREEFMAALAMHRELVVEAERAVKK